MACSVTDYQIRVRFQALLQFLMWRESLGIDPLPEERTPPSPSILRLQHPAQHLLTNPVTYSGDRSCTTAIKQCLVSLREKFFSPFLFFSDQWRMPCSTWYSVCVATGEEWPSVPGSCIGTESITALAGSGHTFCFVLFPTFFTLLLPLLIFLGLGKPGEVQGYIKNNGACCY